MEGNIEPIDRGRIVANVKQDLGIGREQILELCRIKQRTGRRGSVNHRSGQRPDRILLFYCLNDVDGYKTELFFLRDIDGREVDFLVTDGGKPWFAVEVKSSGKDVSKSLSYYGHKLDIPFLYQVVDEKNIDIRNDIIRVLSMEKFLLSLV